MKKTHFSFLGLVCLVQLVGTAFVQSASAADMQSIVALDSWFSTQLPASQERMLDDISSSGTAAGSVIAAPLQTPINYYYHWVRDAGLTMDVVVTLYMHAQTDAERARYNQLITSFIQFSKGLQSTSNRSGVAFDTGLGEPKFMVDGSPFTGDWGRPQNDGPAIRASTLMRLGNALIDQGQIQWVQDNLYTGDTSAHSIIKTDLEFISHHWQDASFDPWEEVLGDHFFTRMVQRRAMVEGAEFASRMNDTAAASFYQQQAEMIDQSLQNFFDTSKNYTVETLNRVGGLSGKTSGLDVAVILGAIHGAIQLHASTLNSDDAQFSVIDDRIILTAQKLKHVFKELFPINANSGAQLAPAIGRYPEDHFNGLSTSSLGNPWFLATNALAEMHYQAANLFEKNQSIQVTQAVSDWIKDLPYGTSLNLTVGSTLTAGSDQFNAVLESLRAGGDQFMNRSQFHADGNGDMSEEMDRNSGYMTGAENLTWSHASVLTAAWARQNY